MIVDILAALEVIATQSQLNSNLSNKAIIMGHSAGGHLAALAAEQISTKLINQQDLYPLFKQTYLIGLAPIINMPEYAFGDNSCQQAAPSFMNNKPNDIFFDANPLKAGLENTTSIMFSGGADSIVQPVLAKHPNANNITLDSVGHFDWIHPGSDAFNTLIQTLETIQ